MAHPSLSGCRSENRPNPEESLNSTSWVALKDASDHSE
jgi:hypothetical protein